MKARTRVWVLAAVSALTLAGCATANFPVDLPGLGNRGKMSDEQMIAAILDDVHEGMESKRIYKVLAHVSKNYQDLEGRDYAGIRDYLSDVMRGYQEITITRARPRILVHGDRARAVEAFGTIADPYNVAGGPPINLQGHVAVYLERFGEEWKIVEWGPLH